MSGRTCEFTVADDYTAVEMARRAGCCRFCQRPIYLVPPGQELTWDDDTSVWPTSATINDHEHAHTACLSDQAEAGLLA